jgi:hypothetical protein
MERTLDARRAHHVASILCDSNANRGSAHVLLVCQF